MKLKKLISLVLSLIMVLSLFVPAVYAADGTEYPIIYVTGSRNKLYA
ncbi:MAG: hypothetical protein IJW86_01355 [Clostridia bacterium]|nr:hypothetical protein [Clostridia bacterium]